MMTAFIIVVIHFIADFIFQAEQWATNKSKSNRALLLHTATYSFIWFFASSFLFIQPCDLSNWAYAKVDIIKMLEFAAITFVAHTITDYLTSRVVSQKFANNEYGSPIPNLGAFTIIGFDQVLHYGQLFGTYYLLTN
jgi:hypothetical protein